MLQISCKHPFFYIVIYYSILSTIFKFNFKFCKFYLLNSAHYSVILIFLTIFLRKNFYMRKYISLILLMKIVWYFVKIMLILSTTVIYMNYLIFEIFSIKNQRLLTSDLKSIHTFLIKHLQLLLEEYQKCNQLHSISLH